VEHLFWTCPVAGAVREEIEGQLRAFNMLPAGESLPCRAVWLACPPHHEMHRLVWDMVCLAAVHAFDKGRRAAWAVASDLGVPVLVEQVAVRAALGAFRDALADFAATARVPRRYKNLLFTAAVYFLAHCAAG
jgi:hypothetical protein